MLFVLHQEDLPRTLPGSVEEAVRVEAERWIGTERPFFCGPMSYSSFDRRSTHCLHGDDTHVSGRVAVVEALDDAVQALVADSAATEPRLQA